MNPQAAPAQTLFGMSPIALVIILAVVGIAFVIGVVALVLLMRRDDPDAIANALLPPKPVGPNPIQQLHDQGLIRDPDVLAIKDAIARDNAIQAQRAAGGAPPTIPTTLFAPLPTPSNAASVSAGTSGVNTSGPSVPPPTPADVLGLLTRAQTPK